MNLDEQIATVDAAISADEELGAWAFTDESLRAILASLRELKRLREAVDVLSEAYAHGVPIATARAYQALREVRDGQ